MERYDSTMRAARYLLGAGTIAVAMVATTAERASAQTSECRGEVPTVCGHVYTETNGTDGFQAGEGEGNITVVVTTTGGVPVSMTNNPAFSNSCPDVNSLDCGYFAFDIPDSGDYLVCLQINGVTSACKEVTGGVQGQIVDLPVTDSEEPVDAEQPYTVSGNGTGTPGYWKNHAEMWPDSITVGGVTYYKNGTPSISDAIAMMGKVSKDKTITMFASLISAKLNTATNNYDCIAGTLFHADKWLTTYPVGSGVAGSSDAWEVGEPLHSKLDDYNNGKLCAPHRN
jgi:hypothetical protein